jgi:hypothetical protein
MFATPPGRTAPGRGGAPCLAMVQWSAPLSLEGRAKESRGFTRSNVKPRNDHHVNMVEYESESSDDEGTNMCVIERDWTSMSRPFI